MTTESPAFELERFRWSGPDRLEVSGRFAGLGNEVKDAVLVVRGPAGAQELTAVPGSVWDGPTEGGRWHARFAWPTAPTAFDAAELRIGDALVVELPDPPGRRRSLASRHLEVRRRAPGEEPPAVADAEPDVPTAQLRLQAQLLVAREEARELRGELERAQEDLAATRTALESERERHAANAEQFRHDLADVQAAAEEAVAAATGRVAELEAAAGEMDTLRAQADEHERLRTAVGEARAALEAVLDRLPAAPGR
jgi:hypothetical protein